MGESAIVDKHWVRVENPRVRPTVLHDASAWQRLRATDGQYLVVDVTTRGPVPNERREFDIAATVDGERVATDPIVVADEAPGGPSDPSEWENQSLAFPLPAASHERAAVCWQVAGTTVRWPLSESTLATLAAEPAFRIENMSVRRLDSGEVELSLRVANEGEREARFQAQVSFQALHDDSSVVAFEVPAGETASYQGVPPILEYQGVGTVTVWYRAGGKRHRADLSVPASDRTPTASRTTGGNGSGSSSGGATASESG